MSSVALFIIAVWFNGAIVVSIILSAILAYRAVAFSNPDLDSEDEARTIFTVSILWPWVLVGLAVGQIHYVINRQK